MNKYEWEGINFPSQKDDWKLNVIYAKKEKIYPAYDSNYYSNCEVIILMISNLEK